MNRANMPAYQLIRRFDGSLQTGAWLVRNGETDARQHGPERLRRIVGPLTEHAIA